MLIVLGLFVVLIGGCGLFVFNSTRGPVDATNIFVANLDDGNLAEAHGSLCSRVRSSTPFDEWAAGLDARLRGGEITDYNFTSVSVSNNSVAVVTGTIEIDGFDQQSRFDLVSEGGSWRVCSVSPLG